MKTFFVVFLLCLQAQSQIHFQDVTVQMHLDVETAHGASFADLNNDGYQDVFIANVAGAPYLLINNAGSGFTNILQTSGMASVGSLSISSIWLDIDNDDRLDLFVAGYTAPNRLFLNLGDGLFQDISGKLPPEPYNKMTYGAAAADYDNDGWIDLYIYHFTEGANDQLLHNNGDLTFTDVTELCGLRQGQSGKTRMALWCDYDRDGDVDLYVGGQRVQVLYTNEQAFFSVNNSWNGDARGVSWIDYNRDGYLDLNICYLEGRIDYILLNDRMGHFILSSPAPGCNLFTGLVNTAWVDFDNDCDLDACAIGYGFPDRLIAVLENDGANTFNDITSRSGINTLIKGYGVQSEDIDNDGDMDLYLTDADSRQAFLYLNTSNGGNWLTLQLKGVKSNRAAIGAQVHLYTGGTMQTRQVESGNYGGQQSLRISFGLGSNLQADSIHIEWPSGIHQTLHNVTANQFLTIFEQGTVPVNGAVTGLSIADVPGDQGKRVCLKWRASYYDHPSAGEEKIDHYSIFRFDKDHKIRNSGLSSMIDIWNQVAELPATADSLYAVIVPTVADSGAIFEPHLSIFMVRACAAQRKWNSLPVQGYSVDNLAPDPIREIRAIVLDNRHYVIWTRCQNPDFLYYSLYRSCAGDSLQAYVDTDESFFIDEAIVKDLMYEYAVTATDSAGNESSIMVTAQALTDVSANPALPKNSLLLQNFPNPFNNSTVIEFETESQGWVTLRIYNVKGELVDEVVNDLRPAGRYRYQWQAFNASGRPLADGIFFLEMKAGAHRQMRKMLHVL